MNPPFGDPSQSVLAYLKATYKGQPNDLYACFIERVIDKMCIGIAGQITSHTFLTYGSYAKLRQEVIYEHAKFSVLADFGLGIMDDAMVRSAAYTLDIRRSYSFPSSIFYRMIESENKEEKLINLCASTASLKLKLSNTYIIDQSLYGDVGEGSLAYWIPHKTIDRFRSAKKFAELAGDPRLGVQTSNNEQFLRLIWEVDPYRIGKQGWQFYVKGGDFLKYYSDIHLVIDWRSNGQHIANSYGASVRLRDTSQYEKPGLNYPLVNEFGVNVGVLPKGTIFDNTSPAVYAHPNIDLYVLLGLINSRFVELCFRCLTSTRHWQVGYLRQISMGRY